MYLRAGVFSLGLLLLSRVLGLLRESMQAAAFGSTGIGDAVIVMFTLPDLLVGILLSGALSYVLVPAWARQSVSENNASQKKIARVLLCAGLVLSLAVWAFRDVVVQALAPGLSGDMKVMSAASLAWSAAVLPLAMLAALWVTRLQHERDFVGMYAGNLIVNLLLVAALFAVAKQIFAGSVMLVLGVFLVLAMLTRLAWLAWRLPHNASLPPIAAPAGVLPKATVWVWAALSSGLLLVLPLVARSLASQAGEGALASFNYAWKLIELPLVLAVQLVASLAFPAITRTEAGTPARDQALEIAFLLAWALACAAVAIVATFSLPLTTLLFGWGRMSTADLEVIAQWGAIGVWSLLPQALIAVLLTVLAMSQRMHLAVWAYAGGLSLLLLLGATGVSSGAATMWALNAVLAGVALVLMVAERRSVKRAFPWFACLLPLLAGVALIWLKPLFAGLSVPLTMILCGVYGFLVVGSAVLASPILRGLLLARLRRLPPAIKPQA